jgi:hypothetical protein
MAPMLSFFSSYLLLTASRFWLADNAGDVHPDACGKFHLQNVSLNRACCAEDDE